MNEPGNLWSKAETGPNITHWQNTASSNREPECAHQATELHVLPFPGGLLPPDVPWEGPGPRCSAAGRHHARGQSLHDWPEAVSPDGKGHLASLCNATLRRSA